MAQDILVLGAGMVGVCTALALRQRGHAVVLVDRQAPGRETSYGNAGIIQREAVQPYAFPLAWQAIARVALGRGNDVHYHAAAMPALLPSLMRYRRESAPDRYGPTVKAYSALIRHSISEHAQLMAQVPTEDLVRRDGWLQVYRSGQALAPVAREAQALAQSHGLQVQVLDAAELAALEPSVHGTVAGAIHWQDPWTVRNPGELVQRYLQLFQSLGGLVRRGDARSLRAVGAGWAVDSQDGPLQAQQAVLALGPWTPAVTEPLDYRFPLFVKRGYHRHYAGAPLPTRPLLDAEHGVMLAPMEQGLRITTGAEFARHDAPATPVQLQRAEGLARELLSLGTPVEDQPWLGARPCVADMRPLVGRAPRHPGLWLHCGHGHQGFTLGPATARLLAEQMNGDTPYVDPAPYDPARFGR